MRVDSRECEAAVVKPYLYKVPWGGWAFAYLGIMSDGYPTRKAAYEAAKRVK